MDAVRSAMEETITLKQAKKLVQCMAHEQSFLLLSAPGVGKSEMVYQAAKEVGIPCRSLLGTQIAPEDVSGIPRIIGERSVFCPPRVLLPEDPEPFCLFLDELPACTPDVQKAFYSLLLERRLGEHMLPSGTWVIAAGNRQQDRALVRSLSSALVNRVTIVHLRVDAGEWQEWATRHGIRADIRNFISFMPDALMRPVPAEPVPFSTPRAWSLLSRALDMAQSSGVLNRETRRALAFGRLSAEDAAVYCALAEEAIGPIQPIERYFEQPDLVPNAAATRWFILDCVRQHVRGGKLAALKPAHGQSLPAQASAREPTHAADRPGRAVGCARRRSRDVRDFEEGHVAMTRPARATPSSGQTLARIENGLRMVTVPLPHLAGLAGAVRVAVDDRDPDHGRVRIGPHRCQPAIRGAAQGQRACLRAGA